MSFIASTRQNIATLPAQTCTASGRNQFILPKVGLLSRLFLTVEGTMTVTPGTGAATISDRTAYNFIKRIRVIANTGSSIFDVSGFGAYIINRMNHDSAITAANVTVPGLDDYVNTTPVNSGANAWKMCLEIPIAINPADPVGMVLLQNNSTQITVEVEFYPEYNASGLFAPIQTTSNATAAWSGGKLGLAMEYFTLPKDQADYPGINVIHQWTEQQNAITAAGAFNLSLLRGNTYMRLGHIITVNGATNTAAIEQLRILYNQAENPYTIPSIVQLNMQRQRYGTDLPRGVFMHDWYTTGNGRDFINSANVTEFQSEIGIASATSIGANSFVNTLSEQLIRIG